MPSPYTFTVVAGTTASPNLDGQLITMQSDGNFVYEPTELDTVSGTFWIWGIKVGQIKETVQVSPSGGGLADFSTSYVSTLSATPTGATAIKTAAQLSTALQQGQSGVTPVVAGTIQHTIFGGSST